MTAEPHAAEEPNGRSELSVSGPGGISARAKGYRLLDLIWLPMLAAIVYTAIAIAQQGEESKNNRQALMQAMRDSNKAFVDALKESNVATVQAIRELAIEQKAAASAMKQVACLNDPVVRNRSDAREFCKRVVGDAR